MQLESVTELPPLLRSSIEFNFSFAVLPKCLSGEPGSNEVQRQTFDELSNEKDPGDITNKTPASDPALYQSQGAYTGETDTCQNKWALTCCEDNLKILQAHLIFVESLRCADAAVSTTHRESIAVVRLLLLLKL